METLLDLTLNSITYVEFFCMILGIVFLNKYKSTPLVWLLAVLILTFLVEVIGLSLGRTYDNRWLYNLLSFSEFIIISYIYYSVEEMRRFKKVIPYIIFLFVIAVFVEGIYFSEPNFVNYLSYSFGIASVFISIYCLLYFVQLVKSEKVLNFYRSLLFWVSVGLLFYHLCNLPITVLTNDLKEISATNSLLIIQAVLSIIMYLSFSIGFIWSKKQYNT